MITHSGTERVKSGSRDCAYMQLRAARSLWMKFLLLRYSIPRAISVINLTSIWDGRYCRTKTCTLVTHPPQLTFIFCTVEGATVLRFAWTELSRHQILTASFCGKNGLEHRFFERLPNSWIFQHSVGILFWLGLCFSTLALQGLTAYNSSRLQKTISSINE